MFSPTNSAKNCYLHGILRIGSQRHFTFPTGNNDVFIGCDIFWKEGTIFVPLLLEGTSLIEIFTILKSFEFLKKVQNNHLNIKLLKRNDVDNEVVGLVRLSLHQFFIAYRDASLTDRLSDGKFPVISANKLMPVLSPKSGEKIGEIDCLLAMGTEKQIQNIKDSKVWKTDKATVDQSLHKFNESATNLETGNTLDLLNILHKPLPSNVSTINHIEPKSSSFRFNLEIKSARNLPICPKLKKKLNRSPNAKGRHISSTGEEPSTYVTFQANEGEGAMVKSHQGMVYSTSVVEKSSNPVWNLSTCVSVPLNYLISKDEQFILKVWKKTLKSNSHSQTLPCPMEDSVIGCVAIDLKILSANAQHVSGWLDIIDYSGHINGQINVIAKPYEEVSKLHELVGYRTNDMQVENLLDTFESSLDINNTNLSRAIKRKFTELEIISDRLKARLLEVTSDTEMYRDEREISDEQLEEFERDLNTTALENENEIFVSYSPHLK